MADRLEEEGEVEAAGAGEAAAGEGEAAPEHTPKTISEAAQHAWTTLTTRVGDATQVEYESQVGKIAKLGANVADIGEQIAKGYRELRVIPEPASDAGRSILDALPGAIGTLGGSFVGARFLLSIPSWISSIASGSSYIIPVIETALGANPVTMTIIMLLLILFNFNYNNMSTSLREGTTFENA